MIHASYDTLGLVEDLAHAMRQKTIKTACGRRVPLTATAPEPRQVGCLDCIRHRKLAAADFLHAARQARELDLPGAAEVDLDQLEDTYLRWADREGGLT